MTGRRLKPISTDADLALDPDEPLSVKPPANHANCMVCGNGTSLGLRFSPDGPNSVVAIINADPAWQGYAGVMHGGMVSTLLDAAMTHCLFHHNVHAMTASLNVRFFAPVPCTGPIEIRATLSDRRRHMYALDAELLSSGQALARAEARFIGSSDSLMQTTTKPYEHLR